MVGASIPRHELTYGFGVQVGCPAGAVAGAGANGNRTFSSDVQDALSTTTRISCFDGADRLIATVVDGAPVGATPVAGGSLSAVGAGASLVYDSHGNTTRLADHRHYARRGPQR